MNILVLTNLGSRDVILNNQKIEPARDKGKVLFENYDSYAHDLSFPIVQPLLDYLLRTHPKESIHLYLFGTNQEDPAFRNTDTLYFTRLMERRIPEVFGERVQTHTVDVNYINPAYYDSAYKAYDSILSEIIRCEKNASVCYIALAGGTPACNTALLLQGVRRFGDRLHVIYTPQGGEPVPIQAGLQIVNSFREAVVLERLENLDFANAIPILDQLQCSKSLIDLTKYAARRLDFDFRSAQTSLEDALKEGDEETRHFITSRLRHDLDNLLQGSDSDLKWVDLLYELSWNAAICWKHHRYADFLARVYRFQEAVLRYLIEKYYGLPTDTSSKSYEDTMRKWEEGIYKNEELYELLEKASQNSRAFNWHKNDRIAHKILLSFARKPENGIIPPDKQESFNSLVDLVNGLDRLIELRHRTIVGHDFQGVSETTLRDASPGQKKPDEILIEIANRVMALQGNRVQQKNPYQTVADFIRSKLQNQVNP